MSEYLFSYGTLQDEAVQLATFGRRLEGMADSLIGYRVTLLPIKDQGLLANAGHYRNVELTGSHSDRVAGTVFAVTESELELADEYEKTADYVRVLVQLESSRTSWVYLHSGEV